MKRNHVLGVFLISGMLLAAPAGAAPTGSAAPPSVRPPAAGGGGATAAAPARSTTPAKPAPAGKPAPAAKPATPAAKPGALPAGVTPEQAAPAVVVEPPASLPKNFDALIDLKRLAIGNQAGLLKVFERTTGKEAYFRTLDDRNTAFFTAEQREAIFGALALGPEEIEFAARQVMIDYPKLPKRNALAFLGAVGSIPELPPGFQVTLQRYLAERYATEKDNILRRQALLSLALMHRVDAQTVEMVLQVFETEGNLWVTFPVQMFFEHHATTIRQLAHVEVIRTRAGAVSSLYTPNVLQFLDGGAAGPAGVAPSVPAPAAPAAAPAAPAPAAPSATAPAAEPAPGGAALPAEVPPSGGAALPPGGSASP